MPRFKFLLLAAAGLGPANAQPNGRVLSNPTTPIKLFGPTDDGLAGIREQSVFSGAHLQPWTARSIEVSDWGSGTAAGPERAAYGLSISVRRPSWFTNDTHVGEMDALSLVLRQGRGDGAGILSNIGIRQGFAATLESYTFSADNNGRVLRAVNVQLGTVNAAGGEYGLVVQANKGKDLSSGLRVVNSDRANWADFFEAVTTTGNVIARIRGIDGAFIGGSVAPAKDRAADVGAPMHRYNAAYLAHLNLSDLPVFADQQAARSGGLTPGDVFRTATGLLMVAY